VQDFWLEQIVKRGLTSFQLPMVLAPSVNWGWAVVLLVAVAVYSLAFRRLARSGSQAAHRRRGRWVPVRAHAISPSP
jgi:hypothetical protein